ncbi:DNA polymerase IV [Pseudoalteromonas sp. P1-25]|uniref:DNA polymerase IV n=1 Tax=Pseudoalteromonas sp. P1-25 TaxID=1723758 RepID=UPI0006D6794B|nr:DNA polymerase IV [Pseudoalteromonas sp. P1-25]KPZ54286.1 DNA polymerase IV [Pseudoalteromonas sp. P1-25]
MSESSSITYRKIIHVDMDAFYVSVEIRDNPSLANKPVAVGGSRTSRGVLSTCNYIARQFGVKSAMPTSVALRKCPDLVLLRGRMDVYKLVSSQIREIFERYTDLIEPLSLDEAYLDVTNCHLFGGSATLIAQDICRSIYAELNLTASAGIAPVKYLAKVASDLNKPNGIFVIPPKNVDSFIDNMELKKIPGVGRVTNDKLLSNGFKYGKDVKASSLEYLSSRYGKLGRLLWERCSGVDDRPVVTSRERKSVGVERTFPEDISETQELERILFEKLLPELEQRASKYLNNRGISKIGIKVKFSDFHQTTKEFSTEKLDRTILCELLYEAFLRGGGKHVRLLGVHIGLSPEKVESEQISFDW